MKNNFILFLTFSVTLKTKKKFHTFEKKSQLHYFFLIFAVG